MAAGYLLLELFRQSITLWLEFLMICGCSNVYFVSYMTPFRWPNIQNDLALAKEVAARKPQTHQAPVVQTMDSAIHRINRYPLDK